MENWRTVRFYEDLYEVSDLGRVRAKNGRLLKPWTTRNGYVHVTLSRDKQKKQMLVHRMVAYAFLPQESGKTYVNHKNSNPADNRVCNLEWCTQSENIKYAYDHNNAQNAARKRILCVETGQEFYSSIEAATWVNSTKYGNTKSLKTIGRGIRQTANGTENRPTAYGYRWRFV